ncbi:uncharacterized protein ARMOST_10621 [Armillaria ostoyae]|uniref:Protein kinase domain-containing protein n=1 Tax=Armillaria ostoyae TaxID=47428 RepID=A0A284REX1_ARMOS|nr:uncharacterized protein ARMOST_10621 [Armillaria ostoyae]
MPRNFNVDQLIQGAKLAAAAGEMVPFPYIKGAAQCAVIFLEAIEKAGKNDEDLQALADDIGTTICIVKEAIEAHGINSATHYHDVCAEFQTYLENLLSELNNTQRNLGRKRFKHFLKTKVSEIINGFKERMNSIKANYVIRTITDSRLEMPEMRDVLSTRITEATETSRLRITSTVESRSDHIVGEIRNLRASQSEQMSQICTKLQDKHGYYKGEVRDLAPGDIYLTKQFCSWCRAVYCQDIHHCRAASPSRHRSVCNYQDGTCTVENSNTIKFIRVYRPWNDNGKDIMQKLDHDINVFIRPRHPNIAQVFGVCRSPNLPAIIFHGAMQVSVSTYLRKMIPPKDIIPFYVEFLHDMESLSDHLTKYCPPSKPESYTDMPNTYVNEHGKLVIAAISKQYNLELPINAFHIDSLQLPTRLIICANLFSSSLQKGDILPVYRTLIGYLSQNHWQFLYSSQEDQPYAPGSILTSHGQTLIGRTQDRLDKWIMECDALYSDLQYKLPSKDSESIPIDFSTNMMEGNTVPLLCPGKMPCVIAIYPHSTFKISDSWIAQASHLYSDLRSRGCVDNDDDLDMINGSFYICLGLKDEHDYCFHLSDTFMVEEPHTLSLLIRAPIVDDQTNKVSWPVLSWLYNTDLEISQEEAEEEFDFKMGLYWDSHPISASVLLAMPEFNAEYGFNPTHKGTDICERYGLPLLEIFDVSSPMEGK